MTSSRIVRGTKGRVFLYICAVLFITGLIACYNNVRLQLEETHTLYEQCKQEQATLSGQLQGIYEYKQRLEKSLKTEKGDHQRTKTEFENKTNEEKLRYEKINTDSKIRFSTLQKHYNILQTQHDDFKEECSKIQRQQLDEINNLQSKLKEVQEELKLALNDKENSLQHLKTQNQLLIDEKQKLKDKLQVIHASEKEIEPKRTEFSTTHFSKIVAAGDSQYIIPEDKLMEESQKRVIPLPNNLAAPTNLKSSTVNTLKAVSVPSMNGPRPLKYPTVTPESVKRTTSKEAKTNDDILPIPYSNKKVPAGFVPVPRNIDQDSKLDQNNQLETNVISGKGINDKEVLKQSINNAENDMANEVFDVPQNIKADSRDKLEDVGPDPEYDHHLDDGDDDLDDAALADRIKDEAIRH